MEITKKHGLCHLDSYDKGISEIAKSYLRQCLHVQTIKAVPPLFQKYAMHLQITVFRGTDLASEFWELMSTQLGENPIIVVQLIRIPNPFTADHLMGHCFA